MPEVSFQMGSLVVDCKRQKKPRGPWRWELGGVHWRYWWFSGGQLERQIGTAGWAACGEFNQLHDAVYYSIGFLCGVAYHAGMTGR